MWVENYLSDEEMDLALRVARGCYQRGLLQGQENLSGSTLKGKAKSYAGRYAKSRDTLLSRLDQAGIAYSEKTGKNNRRILVLGDPEDTEEAGGGI